MPNQPKQPGLTSGTLTPQPLLPRYTVQPTQTTALPSQPQRLLPAAFPKFKPFVSKYPAPNQHPEQQFTSNIQSLKSVYRQQPAPSLPTQVLQKEQPAQVLKRPVDPRREPVLLKRLSESRDPRLRLEKKPKPSNSIQEVKQPTPLSLSVILCKGNNTVSPITLKGNQKCFHKDQIEKLITAQAKQPNHLHIVSFVPLNLVNDIIDGRQISLMDVVLTGPLVNISKLKSYLHVNEIAGIAYDPNDTRQVIVFVSVDDLSKLPNVPRDNGLLPYFHQICAIFIDDVPPKLNIDVEQVSLDLMSESDQTTLIWEKAVKYLRFPPKLERLRTEAKFIIYGHSVNSTLLIEAITKLRPIINPKAHVMMFDRYNDALFSKSLTRHKKEPSTQLWEFGIPDLSVERMLPPEQVFPNYSGGFITTDATNIICRPSIIDDICNEIEKLNSDINLKGSWRFILPYNFISHIKKTVKNQKQAEAAQNAIIKISLALSNNKIEILKPWSAELQDLNSVRFLDAVTHSYYKKHQFFVFVDEISSVASPDRLCSLDFVHSSQLSSTFM